jgi:hypothetical protein
MGGGDGKAFGGSARVSDEPRLLELLTAWEEQRQQGRTVTAEQLCPDDAALQAVLRTRIDKRQRLQGLLEMPGETLPEPRRPAPTPAVPLLAGYEILGVLGRGGMGVVYKARQIALNRLVAIKMVLAGANATRHELARFRTEAEAGARLQHANIVQIHAVGDHAGCPYLVLELVEGGSLAQSLGGLPLPARRAAELIHTLALAVEHAHQHGIVHRDLKPGNVLMDGTTLKIADFGLAKRLDVDYGQTQTGAVVGSPSYMAPEQAEGRTHAIGPAVDIYALGAMLYEMLTGRPPFVAESMLETLEQVKHMDAVPPRRLQPKLPRDLEAICLKCLEKEPSHRYGSAAALAEDLQRFLEGDPIHARSASLLDQVVRNIGHYGVDAHFRPWSGMMLLLAPLPLLIHVLAFVLLRAQDAYPYAMVAVSGVTAVALTLTVFLTNWASMERVQRRQRRHLRSSWFGHLISFVLVPVVLVTMLPLQQAEEIFIVYPLWALLAATTFYGMASEMGALYIVATLCHLAALLMMLVPAWSPFVVGVLMTTNLTTQGLFMRRLQPNSVRA